MKAMMEEEGCILGGLWQEETNFACKRINFASKRYGTDGTDYHLQGTNPPFNKSLLFLMYCVCYVISNTNDKCVIFYFIY